MYFTLKSAFIAESLAASIARSLILESSRQCFPSISFNGHRTRTSFVNVTSKVINAFKHGAFKKSLIVEHEAIQTQIKWEELSNFV